MKVKYENLIKKAKRHALSYERGKPTISDREYDRMIRELREMEEKVPEMKRTDSPTSNVIGTAGCVKHNVPMLSMQHTYSLDDIERWFYEVVHGNPVCVEMKIDGVAISLIYEDGSLVCAATRGDGFCGMDVTENFTRYCNSVPKTIPIKHAVIRGEVFMTREHFEELSIRSTARNATAGALFLKNPEKHERKLSFIAYDIVECSERIWDTHFRNMCLLFQMGFDTGIRVRCYNARELINSCLALEEKRGELPYDSDGVVVKVDDITLREKMGSTQHHHNWQIAYKFGVPAVETTVTGVEYSVSKNGRITPVLIVEPVEVEGKTVRRVNMGTVYNAETIGVGVGSRVEVSLSGGASPVVVSVLTAGNKIEAPSCCPECGGEVECKENSTILTCKNHTKTT